MMFIVVLVYDAVDGLIVLSFRAMNLSFRCLVLVYFILCDYVYCLGFWLLVLMFGRLVVVFEFDYFGFDLLMLAGYLWFVLLFDFAFCLIVGC